MPEWLTSDFSARLALTLLHCLWQGTAVAVTALCVTRLWHASGAQVRYVIHVVALATVVAFLPVTYLLVTPPTQKPGDLASAAPLGPFEGAAIPEPLTDTVTTPSGTEQPEMHSDAGAIKPAAPTETETLAQDVGPVLPVPLTESKPDLAAGSISTPESRETWLLLTLAPYAVVVYLLGVAVMLLRVMFALWGGQRLRVCAERVTDVHLLRLVRQQARRLGLRATPAIYNCRRVATPVVLGVLRPTILLPCVVVTGLSGDQLRAVLMHELAHIRRLDPLVNLFQRIAESLLFFHPAAWYLSRRASVERENCCDDLVLNMGLTRLDYAQLLLKVAELSTGSPHSAALAATGGRPSQLRQRILRLLSGDEERVRLTRRGTVSLAAMLMAAVLIPLLLFPAQAEPESPNQPVENETSDDGIESVPNLRFEIIEQDPATLHNLKTFWTIRDREDGSVVQKIFVHVGDRGEWQDENGDGFADLRVWDGQYDPDTKPAWYSVYFYDPLSGKFVWGCRSEKEIRPLSSVQFETLVKQVPELESGMSREQVAKTLEGFNLTHRPFLNAYPRDHDLYRLAISEDDTSAEKHSFNLLLSYQKQSEAETLKDATLVDLRDRQAIARDIKQDLTRVVIQLDYPYQGPAEQRPDYKSLTLQTSPLEPGQSRPPWWTTARISQREASKLVDQFTVAGLLRRVRVSKSLDADEPHYRLKLMKDGRDAYAQNFGWGPRLRTRLVAMEKVLTGEAAKALGQLLQELPVTDKPAQPKLGSIRWHNRGVRQAFWLRLNPSGTYHQNGIRRRANANIERLADQVFGENGVVVPVAQYTDTTESKPVTGRWQWLSSDHGIVLLDENRGARLRRVGSDGTEYEFDWVRLSRMANLGPAIKSNWTPLDDTWSVETTDLATWRGEQSLTMWAKPARGHVVAKSEISTETERMIRAALPATYSVTGFGNTLLVARDAKAATEAHFPSASAFSTAAEAWNQHHEERFVLELKFGRRTAPASWRKEAARLDTAMAAQREKMKAFADPPRSKPSGSGYQPRDVAERRLHDQYVALSRERAALPEFYNETNSLQLRNSFGPYIAYADMAADHERRQATATIRQFFSRYELSAEAAKLAESFRKQSRRLEVRLQEPAGDAAIILAGPEASPAKTKNETIVRISPEHAVAIVDLLAARGYFEIQQDAGPAEDSLGTQESQHHFFQKARTDSRLTLTATNSEGTTDRFAIGVAEATYRHWFRAIQNELTGKAAKEVGGLLSAQSLNDLSEEELVKSLKENWRDFSLTLSFSAPPRPDSVVPTHPTLILMARADSGEDDWKRHVLPVYDLPREQVHHIIDHLSRTGLLERGQVALKQQESRPKGMLYTLRVSDLGPVHLGGGQPMQVQLRDLRKALIGDSAKAMDELLAKFGAKSASHQPTGNWGNPVGGISVRVTHQAKPFTLVGPNYITVELKKVAADAVIPHKVLFSQLGLWHNSSVSRVYPFGSATPAAGGIPVESPKAAKIGEVFFRLKLDVDENLRVSPWINADYPVRIGFTREPNDQPVLVAMSQPFNNRIDLNGSAEIRRLMVTRTIEQMNRDRNQAAKRPGGIREPWPPTRKLEPWFLEIVNLDTEKAENFRDNPEEFVAGREGEAASIWPNQLAGYIYGYRVALKQQKSGKFVPYVPTAKWRDRPFIQGFLLGYRDTLAPIRKPPKKSPQTGSLEDAYQKLITEDPTGKAIDALLVRIGTDIQQGKVAQPDSKTRVSELAKVIGAEIVKIDKKIKNGLDAGGKLEQRGKKLIEQLDVTQALLADIAQHGPRPRLAMSVEIPEQYPSDFPLQTIMRLHNASRHEVVSWPGRAMKWISEPKVHLEVARSDGTTVKEKIGRQGVQLVPRDKPQGDSFWETMVSERNVIDPPISAGNTVTAIFSLPSLPPGEYTVRLPEKFNRRIGYGSSGPRWMGAVVDFKPVHIKIIDDTELRKRKYDELLARLRNQEPLAMEHYRSFRSDLPEIERQLLLDNKSGNKSHPVAASTALAEQDTADRREASGPARMPAKQVTNSLGMKFR